MKALLTALVGFATVKMVVSLFVTTALLPSELVNCNIELTPFIKIVCLPFSALGTVYGRTALFGGEICAIVDICIGKFPLEVHPVILELFPCCN